MRSRRRQTISVADRVFIGLLDGSRTESLLYLSGSNARQCNIFKFWEAVFRSEALATFQPLAEEAPFWEDHHPLELLREINLKAR